MSLAIPLLACSEPALPEVMNAARVEPQCEGVTNSEFLRPELLPPSPRPPWASEGWTAGWSLILEAMQEPRLWCGVAADSYRIVWLHSFSTLPHWPPTMVRMSRSGGGWTLTAVQLASFVNRTATLRRQRLLSDAESLDMMFATNEFGLWNRQWDFAQEISNVNDGATWVIEGRRGSAYRPMKMSSPHLEEIEKLAVVFLKLAGINPKMLHEGIDFPPPSP